jgi:hypothetical protein
MHCNWSNAPEEGLHEQGSGVTHQFDRILTDNNIPCTVYRSENFYLPQQEHTISLQTHSILAA